MAIMDDRFEGDVMRLWNLVVDLSEQLSLTKSVASRLHNETIQLKAQALHSETGFIFRRFNAHLSQEEYDNELERMNTDLANENQGLQYDNKQLNALLKEYEQTLDNVMASFRKRAHDVQLQELETIKQFETKLVSAETSSLNTQLNVETSVSVLIAECSRLLRMVLRLMGGEEPASSSQPSTPPEMDFIPSTSSSNMLEMRCAPELANPVPTDWALEREIELARLEQENAELRMLLQASQSASESTSLPPSLPRVPSARVHSLMPRRQKVFRAQYPPDDPNVIELHLQPHEGRRDMVTLSDEIL